MDFRRIRPSEMLALAAAAVVVAALFMPWFEFRSGRLDAWRSLSVTLAPLLLGAAMGIYLFVITLTQRSPALPIAAAVWTTLIGLVGSVWVLVRVLLLPGGALGHCYGSWVGLAGMLLVFAAGWSSMRDERPARGTTVMAR